MASCTNNLVSRQIIIRFLIPQLTSTTSIQHSTLPQLTNHKRILTPDSRLYRPQPQLATLLIISIRASMHNKFYHLAMSHKFYHLVLSRMQYHKDVNRSTRSITWLLRPRILLLLPTKVTVSRTVEVLLRDKYSHHKRKQKEQEVGQPQVTSLIQRRKNQLMSKEVSSGLLPICLKRTTKDSETSSLLLPI